MPKITKENAAEIFGRYGVTFKSTEQGGLIIGPDSRESFFKWTKNNTLPSRHPLWEVARGSKAFSDAFPREVKQVKKGTDNQKLLSVDFWLEKSAAFRASVVSVIGKTDQAEIELKQKELKETARKALTELGISLPAELMETKEVN